MEHQSQKEAKVNTLRDEDKDRFLDFSNRLANLSKSDEITDESVRELELLATELLGLAFTHHNHLSRWLKQGYIGS
jgi:hypothetical protein